VSCVFEAGSSSSRLLRSKWYPATEDPPFGGGFLRSTWHTTVIWDTCRGYMYDAHELVCGIICTHRECGSHVNKNKILRGTKTISATKKNKSYLLPVKNELLYLSFQVLQMAHFKCCLSFFCTRYGSFCTSEYIKWGVC